MRLPTCFVPLLFLMVPSILATSSLSLASFNKRILNPFIALSSDRNTFRLLPAAASVFTVGADLE